MGLYECQNQKKTKKQVGYIKSLNFSEKSDFWQLLCHLGIQKVFNINLWCQFQIEIDFFFFVLQRKCEKNSFEVEVGKIKTKTNLVFFSKTLIRQVFEKITTFSIKKWAKNAMNETTK